MIGITSQSSLLILLSERAEYQTKRIIDFTKYLLGLTAVLAGLTACLLIAGFREKQNIATNNYYTTNYITNNDTTTNQKNTTINKAKNKDQPQNKSNSNH